MKEVYEKECGSRLYYKNLEKRLFSMKVSCLITILIEYTSIKVLVLTLKKNEFYIK